LALGPGCLKLDRLSAERKQLTKLSTQGASKLKKKIEDTNFLVVGVVRNCEKKIEADVERIALALEKAKKLYWFIVESDSDDRTLSVLKRIKCNTSNFNFESLGGLSSKKPLRTDRIAHCRNRYLAEVRENKSYRDIDLVVVADFDGLNTHINLNAIKSCWERHNWDMCAANQDGPYYDIFALRHFLWSPNNCFEQLNFFNSFRQNYIVNRYISVYSKMIRIPQEADWIEVDSAFGGFAVYNKSILDFGEYIGISDSGLEQCEHVPFHKRLKENGARLYINPRLINAKRTEHTRNNFLKMMLPNRAKEFIKKIIKH